MRKTQLPRTFAVAFTVLAALTFFVHWRSPLGPGQDYHYHLMVSALNGRPFGDPIRALYKTVNPLDANTLAYTLAFPLEKIFDPIRAFQLVVTGVYFLGLPLACAVALRRVGRSPWGALLAFPLAYGHTWTDGGFVPFLSAAPFFVVAIGEFCRAHASTGKEQRRAMLLCMLFTTLTFLGHGHVYMWLGLLLGMLTLVWVARELGALPAAPLGALRSSFRVAWKSLAMIAPSLLVFGRWYVATHYGEAAAGTHLARPTLDPPWADRLAGILRLVQITRDEVEARHLVAIGMAVLACLVLVRRPRIRFPAAGFDVCLLVTVLSIFVLPTNYSGQTVAFRHIDLSMWLLPLVVIDVLPPRPRLVEMAAVAALFVVSLRRVDYLGEQLKLLNEDDFKGLVSVAEQCRKVVPREGAPKLAYAALEVQSKHFTAWSIHQAHETVAAVCGIDTPVYNPNIYPHNLLPLRYRDGLPAPITILSRRPPHDGLFDEFEYVLVQGWKTPLPVAEKILERGVLVAASGDFELWRRR